MRKPAKGAGVPVRKKWPKLRKCRQRVLLGSSGKECRLPICQVTDNAFQELLRKRLLVRAQHCD